MNVDCVTVQGKKVKMAEIKIPVQINLPDDWKEQIVERLKNDPDAEWVEVTRCKDCKHWRQQTNYAGVPLSFGFCESDEMWRSLYGETYEVSHIDTDDDFYCGYAERREDG